MRLVSNHLSYSVQVNNTWIFLLRRYCVAEYVLLALCFYIIYTLFILFYVGLLNISLQLILKIFTFTMHTTKRVSFQFTSYCKLVHITHRNSKNLFCKLCHEIYYTLVFNLLFRLSHYNTNWALHNHHAQRDANMARYKRHTWHTYVFE